LCFCFKIVEKSVFNLDKFDEISINPKNFKISKIRDNLLKNRIFENFNFQLLGAPGASTEPPELEKA